MDLAKFQDIASSIVTNAIKELSIERGVKEVSEVWKSMEFTVIRHYIGKKEKKMSLQIGQNQDLLRSTYGTKKN